MKKNVIISLADANYFLLLNELIDSIKRFKESEQIAICILDAGLTDEQKKDFSNSESKFIFNFINTKIFLEQAF